jgi:multicomponent K+:H+ antiporter subunit F
MNLLPLALDIATLAFGLAMVLCTVRLVAGPSGVDRIIAVDALYLNAVALIVLLGLRWGTPLLFEGALLVAMLGFASTVALARYLTRGEVIE